jgi:hypothetical protein
MRSEDGWRPARHLGEKALGLIQSMADEECGDRGNHADGEHTAPTDDRQEQGRDECCGQHAGLPAQPDIGGRAGTHGIRPGLGNHCHADAELAAQSEAGQYAEQQQAPVILRDRTEAGKYRKDHDCPGKHANAPSLVGQYAEQDTANHCGDQCRGNQGGRLRGTQTQPRADGPQHEAEDQQVKPVHRVTDGATNEGAAGGGRHGIGRSVRRRRCGGRE